MGHCGPQQHQVLDEYSCSTPPPPPPPLLSPPPPPPPADTPLLSLFASFALRPAFFLTPTTAPIRYECRRCEKWRVTCAFE